MKTFEQFCFDQKIVQEGYDNVSMEYIKNRKKLSEYRNYDNKMVKNNHTYLNFNDTPGPYGDWFLWSHILVFDNQDETEIANSSYGKENKNSKLKASIDVRSDYRRQGIASNVYQWIEKLTHEKLYPDTPHTKSAEKLWSNPNRKFGFDR